MTGTEVAQAAVANKDKYKYIYGAKGELCTAAHIEDLIVASPSYFSTESKKEAARSKVGQYCADCSGYVCICAGISHKGSWGLYDCATERRSLVTVDEKVYGGEKTIPVGAVLWKAGHVGIYVGNQLVVESRSEDLDVQVNDVRNRDFTHCLLIPSVQYEENDSDSYVEWPPADSDSTYVKWFGKIVNTPVVIPQVSTSSKNAAIGFGMLNNGVQVIVAGVDGDYYKIQSTEGYFGYVHSQYIGTTDAPAYANQYAQWKGVINGALGYVYVRTGPATTYETHSTVASLENGATVEVLGEVLGNEDNHLWYYVRILNVYTGYIRGDLIVPKTIVNYTSWIGKVEVTTANANIRKSPTVNSEVAGKLANGTKVVVLAEATGDDTIWYQVAVDGVTLGYCRADLIIPNVEDYYVEWDGKIVTPVGSANIRSAASTSASKITGSPYVDGTIVHILSEEIGSDGYTWYKVSVNGTYIGYCRCDLIQTTSDYPRWMAKANTTTGTLNIRTGAGTGYAQLEACDAVPNGTYLTVVSQLCGTDGYVWYKVIVLGAYIGYVKGTLVVPVNSVAYPVWLGCARSTLGYVNVRSEPTTSADVIAGYPKLNNGDCFNVVGQVDGSDGYLWLKICIMDKYYGYVRGDLVSHGTVSEETYEYTPWIGITNSTTGTVNMRADATTSSEIVASLTNGTAVEVIGTKNGTNDNYVWYQVKYKTFVYGYIRSDLLEPTPNIVDDLIELYCPPRGVIILPCYELSYPSGVSEEVSVKSLLIGTYVNLRKMVKGANKQDKWYMLENGSYVRGLSVWVFPEEEYCGGDDYENLEHHDFVEQPYGQFECKDCGYHLDYMTYHQKKMMEEVRNIATFVKIPAEAIPNLPISWVEGEVIIMETLTQKITYSCSLDSDTNPDAYVTISFQNGEVSVNDEVKWGNFEEEVSKIGITGSIVDVPGLAVTIENGSMEGSVSIDINGDISFSHTIIHKITERTSYKHTYTITHKKNDDNSTNTPNEEYVQVFDLNQVMFNSEPEYGEIVIIFGVLIGFAYLVMNAPTVMVGTSLAGVLMLILGTPEDDEEDNSGNVS